MNLIVIDGTTTDTLTMGDFFQSTDYSSGLQEAINDFFYHNRSRRDRMIDLLQDSMSTISTWQEHVFFDGTDINENKSKKGFGRRLDLFFIRFGFLHVGMRFKHFIHYLKQKLYKCKGYCRSHVVIKMMPCNTLIYIKRKKNK